MCEAVTHATNSFRDLPLSKRHPWKNRASPSGRPSPIQANVVVLPALLTPISEIHKMFAHRHHVTQKVQSYMTLGHSAESFSINALLTSDSLPRMDAIEDRVRYLPTW